MRNGYEPGSAYARRVEELIATYPERIERSEQYLRARDAADAFSNHTLIALIGSHTFGLLIPDAQYSVNDFDFLSRESGGPVLSGWQVRRNRAKLDKLVYGDVPEDIPPEELKACFSADVTPIHLMHQLRTTGAEPTLENFLRGTQTDVQSLAYLVHERRLVGDEGLRAVRVRTLGVLSYPSLKSFCEDHSTPDAVLTPEMYLCRKGRELGFKVRLPDDRLADFSK
jgi:hypothetical protein